ncbi:MAG: DUF2520 domain-containing protein [Deltaproteobacteria bacterium]|jgi:predicted short-subunit dehydrogenase-like oxidoreductase (DUF2520 family)|nr:DUF2520 domain-containing protein [Deltaproteobacteria bacterium]
MRIGFIGAGKVGFCLGQYLASRSEAGQVLTIVGYASRDPGPAREAAQLTGSAFFESPLALIQAADLIFLTVPDGLIGPVWESLAKSQVEASSFAGKIFAHCSGSLSSDVFLGLEETGAWGLSLHPLMAIPDKYRSQKLLAEAFFAIEGQEPAVTRVKSLFSSLGHQVEVLDKSKKTLYHCAAAIVSNFAVALAQMGADLLGLCGLAGAEAALFRLELNNARSITEYGPVAALTGPVERGDVGTVAGHLAALTGEDRELYRLLAKKLVKVAQLKRPGQDFGPLSRLLEKP